MKKKFNIRPTSGSALDERKARVYHLLFQLSHLKSPKKLSARKILAFYNSFAPTF